MIDYGATSYQTIGVFVQAHLGTLAVASWASSITSYELSGDDEIVLRFIHPTDCRRLPHRRPSPVRTHPRPCRRRLSLQYECGGDVGSDEGLESWVDQSS